MAAGGVLVHGGGMADDFPTLKAIAPMLLTEVRRPFSGREWLYEIKYDGYRLLARFGDGQCELRTRNGTDASRWYPEIVTGLSRVTGGPHVMDGEVCVLDEYGRSDFDRLHERSMRRRWYEGAPPVAYCAFDLLVTRGRSVMGLPLEDRKRRLARLLKPAPPSVLVVGGFEAIGEQFFAEAVVPLGLEGMVAKRHGSIYEPGARSTDWVKVKRKGATPAQRFSRGPNKAIPED